MLVGREAELRELLGAAAAARAVGRGWTALIGGDAGIGKTRMAAEFADRMAADGVTVAWAACRQDGGAPPYWPFAQLLGRLGRADALTVSHVQEPELARFLLFQAVAEAVRDAAPVLLVLDDLQWADEPSLRLLDALGAHVGPAPVFVLGTYRDAEPDSAAVRTIAAERRFLLRGLSPAELAPAVGDVTGELITPDAAAALHRRTGGNPFFASEVVRLQRSEGTSAAVAVPGGVRAALDRRLDSLPPQTEDVLRAAAALDAGTTGVDAVLLGAVSGHPPADLATVLEPAVATRLVLTAGGWYRFPHALIAETVSARTPAADRLELHRRAGAALRSRVAAGFGSPADAAHQLLAAAKLSGDADEAGAAAIAGALAAQEAIAHVAYEDAVRWLEDTLDVLATSAGDVPVTAASPAAAPGAGSAGTADGVSPRARPDPADLLCALGEAALAAGDPVRSRRAFERAADLARLRQRPELLATAALGRSGGAAGFEVDLTAPDRAALLEEALHALPGTDSALHSGVAARLSVALTFTGAEPRRRQLADDAVTMARRIDDPRGLAAALAARCDALAGPDHIDVRRAAAEEIIRCARRVHDRTIELLGHRIRLVALAESGRWIDVDDEIRSYASVSEPTGQPGVNWYLPLWRGARAAMRADLAAEQEQSAELHRLVTLSGSNNARLLEGTQALVRAVDAGAPQDAVPLLDGFIGGAPDLASGSHPTFALLLALTGEPAAATERLEAYVRSLPGRVKDSEWLPEVVQAAMTAIALRHRAVAATVYESLTPYADLFAIEGICAGTWGCVHAYLGRLADLLGRKADARAHLDNALPLNSAAGAALAERTRRWAAQIDGTAPATGTTVTAQAISGTCRLEGDVWTLEFGGRSVRLKDSKGLRDVAALLAAPGRDVAVQELTHSVRGPESAAFDLADRTAIAAYRRRLIELEQERTDAESMNDPERAARASAGRDALIEELSAITGLGGGPRRAGSDTERMRKAVGNRIRQAVRRIEQVHPELGRHLRISIRTGTFCRYEPAQEVQWTVRDTTAPNH